MKFMEFSPYRTSNEFIVFDVPAILTYSLTSSFLASYHEWAPCTSTANFRNDVFEIPVASVVSQVIHFTIFFFPRSQTYDITEDVHYTLFFFCSEHMSTFPFGRSKTIHSVKNTIHTWRNLRWRKHETHAPINYTMDGKTLHSTLPRASHATEVVAVPSTVHHTVNYKTKIYYTEDEM
jgi:hypothetical protein